MKKAMQPSLPKPLAFSPCPPMRIHLQQRKPLTLLLADTDGPSATAGRLGVLAADAEAPVVPETPVGANLLEALEVLAELRVDAVGQDLVVLAVDNVALAVEEPRGDLVLGRVLEDRDDALELFRGELSGTVLMRFLLEFIVSFLDVSLSLALFVYC